MRSSTSGLAWDWNAFRSDELLDSGSRFASGRVNRRFNIAVGLAVEGAGYRVLPRSRVLPRFLWKVLEMRADKERKTVKATSGVNVVAGVWLIAAPFVLGFTEVADEMWNHIIVGLCVLILAAIRVGQWQSNAWMSWVNLALGAWLIIVPFTLNFAETALWNSVIVGIVVAVMGGWSAAASQSVTGSRTRARAQ